ncbi:MAG: hypothetical protein MO853_07575 [Candidatus Protistobacter heckmanni]|nr:hypothetical protein [Candidatus Protistobacter heckmanni]
MERVPTRAEALARAALGLAPGLANGLEQGVARAPTAQAAPVLNASLPLAVQCAGAAKPIACIVARIEQLVDEECQELNIAPSEPNF